MNETLPNSSYSHNGAESGEWRAEVSHALNFVADEGLPCTGGYGMWLVVGHTLTTVIWGHGIRERMML